MHTELFHTIGGRFTLYKPFTGTQYIRNFKDFCYNILRLASEKSIGLNNEDGLFFRCHQLLKEKYDFETQTKQTKDDANKKEKSALQQCLALR